MISNKRLFQTTEFERWASASGLAAEEAYLAGRFLDKDAATLEAGTGGGRVLLALRRLGFRRLSGFDYVPELVARAQGKTDTEGIDFRVMDAGRLDYPADHFDQVLYFQQLLCVLDGEAARRRAVEEAHRVLKPGGVALFSFLLMEARASRLFYRVLLRYLKILRTVTGADRPLHDQPWLRRGDAPNYAALLDRPPYVYWPTVPDALALLRRAGFAVEHLATSTQLRAGTTHPPEADLRPFYPSDKLYVVCRK